MTLDPFDPRYRGMSPKEYSLLQEIEYLKEQLNRQMGMRHSYYSLTPPGPCLDRIIAIPPGSTEVRVTSTGKVSFLSPVSQLQRGLLKISEALPKLPDPSFPKTMGWRAWLWHKRTKYLYSPQQRTLWAEAELRVDKFDNSKTQDGVPGIHAQIVPVGWRTLKNDYAVCPPDREVAHLIPRTQNPWVPVVGIAERFGKFVQGEKGWRAEWVFIRKLVAPTPDIGLELERAYPTVEILYNDEAPRGHR